MVLARGDAGLSHTARVERFVPMNTGHVWPTLSIKGVPKQLGAMAYQGLLASPGVGRRINQSPRVVGKVVNSISVGSEVAGEYAAQFAPRMADPARARAASQVYRTFQLHEYPKWVRGTYADRRLTTPTALATRAQGLVLHARDVQGPEECPQAIAEHLRAFFAPS